MRRDIASGLVLGCLFILVLEVPDVLRGLRMDLEGPYASRHEPPVESRPTESDPDLAGGSPVDSERGLRAASVLGELIVATSPD